ncbi:MAG TPA: hypothetical protein ACFYEH_09445 [Candidatus Brocadiaceae bacterium]
MAFAQLTYRESLRENKDAIKLHTLMDLCGSIPSFIKPAWRCDCFQQIFLICPGTS